MYNNDVQFFIDCGLPFKIIRRLLGKNFKRTTKCNYCKILFTYTQTTRPRTTCNVCVNNELQGKDRTREIVRRRDNWTCQDCGKKWVLGQRRFDVHHLNGLCGKKSLKYDKISEIDGLITLCHKCHFNRPEHKSKKKYLKNI